MQMKSYYIGMAALSLSMIAATDNFNWPLISIRTNDWLDVQSEKFGTFFFE